MRRWGRWRALDTLRVRDRRRVDRPTAAALATMGPAGHHATPDELAARAEALPDVVEVTVAVDVSVFVLPGR